MSHNVSAGHTDGISRDRRSLLQKAAAAVGAVFLLVGILGFIPGITQNIYPIDLLNTDKRSTHQELLGIFEISVLHNLGDARYDQALHARALHVRRRVEGRQLTSQG